MNFKNISMNNLNNREKLLSIVIISILTLWLLTSLLLKPVIKSIFHKKEILKVKKVKYLKLLNSINEKDKIERKFKEMKLDKKNNLSNAIINSNLLRDLNTIEQQVSVQIDSISQLEPDKVDGFKKFSASIEISNTLEKLMKYLLQIKSSNKNFNLMNLRITAKKRDTLKSILTISQLIPIR